MRLAFVLHFLTLVVLSAQAAPEATVKPTPVQTKERYEPSKSQAEIQTLQASPVPAFEISRKKWKDSNGSTNFGVGTASGQFNKDKETETLTTYHLQRTQYNLDETAQEFGLALTSNGMFSLDWGFKKFCCFTSFAGAWGPYYKLGVAGFYDPKDELGNFIDYKRYFAQISFGLENLFSSRQTWRTELGARSGSFGSQFYLQFLYAIPD